ncbi:DUF1285 domain-containing protein [Microbulbifer sp. DLAB2-AF]|uniref:DUF1285 domain-containing protein n=1 Tax=Microbulbifer variabilis TaxID=266805 RepID=A0ABY4VKW9_9GAMM|nr:DUF1285 domain-containing protein [Microbulbifer variabilis]USD23490.1 DUF1285 domain-containing protein [Microbulbifer variabilis]
MAEPLFQQLQKLQKEFHGHPPVDRWDPDFCGDMDMVIKSDGRWIHEGTEIRRQPLVKLFASILKREGDEYFLVTPVEKLRIQVEDVPFVATQVARSASKGEEQRLLFTTSVGDVIELNQGSNWQLQEFGTPAQPVPYVEARNGLMARVSRDVFYQLVDWAEERRLGENGSGQLFIRSAGGEFLLGSY